MLATQQHWEKLNLCGENYFIHYSEVRYDLNIVIPGNLLMDGDMCSQARTLCIESMIFFILFE
jgi:hypothetical protein